VRSKISEASSGTLLCDIICAEAPLQPCRTATQSAGKYAPHAGQPRKARVTTAAYKMMTKKCHHSKLASSKKVKRRLIILKRHIAPPKIFYLHIPPLKL
jgi:hypothetical protein